MGFLEREFKVGSIAKYIYSSGSNRYDKDFVVTHINEHQGEVTVLYHPYDGEDTVTTEFNTDTIHESLVFLDDPDNIRVKTRLIAMLNLLAGAECDSEILHELLVELEI